MHEFVERVAAQAVVIEAAQATLPAPTIAGDGASIVAMRAASRVWSLELTASGAATLTGPVKIWAYNGTGWLHIGNVAGGENIVLAAAAGYAEKVSDISGYERLAVSCAVSANNITVTLVPLRRNT